MLLWLLLSLWQIGAYPLSEGDNEAASVLLGFRLASAFDDPAAVGSLFVQDRLPLSYLPSVFGAHLLPVNEFTMRLPYALVGAIQMPLLLALTSRIFGRRAAAFAGLMLLGSGLFAINRLAGGIGLFMALELAGTLFLLRYAESGQRRSLVYSSLLLAAATLTYLDGAILLIAAFGIGWLMRRNGRDTGIAALIGLMTVATAVGVTAATRQFYEGTADSAAYVSADNMFSRALSDLDLFGISPYGFAESWMVYLGIPVVLLVLIGLVEAAMHNRPARVPLIVLSLLAGSYSTVVLLSGVDTERVLFAAPLVMAIAGYGWAQLLLQLRSIAAQAVVAMAVAAIAMAGVAWNQSVFNPETEFSTELQGLREYALALDHGAGLIEDDSLGLKAIAHVLREETEPGTNVFVREGVSAAAITLYSARQAGYLDLNSLTDAAAYPDGTFLVIKGEDETFNAGLSGATNVVANHRVFEEGISFYQLIQFSQSGEPFQAPVWWRADAASNRLFSENTQYSDFLPVISRVDPGS